MHREDFRAFLGVMFDKMSNLQHNIKTTEKKAADKHTIWAEMVQTLNDGMRDIKRNMNGMIDVLQLQCDWHTKHHKGKGVQHHMVDDADRAAEADDEGASLSFSLPIFQGSQDRIRLLVRFLVSR